MEQSATTVNSAWNRSRLQYGTTVACNHNTCNPIPPSSRGGRVDAVVAVGTVPAAPAALPMLTVLPPALPLPPPSHNRMPPPPATRHQHSTPTPRQVRAGHYRCCSRRRRWGVPYVSVCVMPDVPAVDKGGTGNSGSGMPKPTGVVGHSGLL